MKDKKTLREYASAMDVLSRNWEKEGDGVSRTEWCRQKLTDYIQKRHAKFCKQHADLEIQSLPANHKLKVLDVGRRVFTVLCYSMNCLSLVSFEETPLY